MSGHIHTDIIAAMFTVAVVVVGLHAMRVGGTALANKNVPGGRLMRGLATFN